MNRLYSVPFVERTNSFPAAPTPPVDTVPVAPPLDVTLSPSANSAPDPLIVEGPT